MSATEIHYGKKFAQTEELLAAKAMNRELEELAGLVEKPAPPPPASTAKHPQVSAKASPVPIGALPAIEEPPQDFLLHTLWNVARQQVGTAQSAAVDLGRAGLRLLGLPFEAAKLLAQRFHFLDA
jgi:hypothetical protein